MEAFLFLVDKSDFEIELRIWGVKSPVAAVFRLLGPSGHVAASRVGPGVTRRGASRFCARTFSSALFQPATGRCLADNFNPSGALETCWATSLPLTGRFYVAEGGWRVGNAAQVGRVIRVQVSGHREETSFCEHFLMVCMDQSPVQVPSSPF